MKKLLAIASLSVIGLTSSAFASYDKLACNVGEIKDGSFLEMNIKSVEISGDEVDIDFPEGTIVNTQGLSAYGRYTNGQMTVSFLLTPKSGEPYEVFTITDSGYANILVGQDERMFRMDCQVTEVPETTLIETETGSILEGIAKP